MRGQILSCALALTGLCTAFSDSTSFVLLSSQPVSKSHNIDRLQVNTSVFDFTQQFLEQCPTHKYLLINQPGMTAANLRCSKGSPLPSLCRAAEASSIQGKLFVPEVIGNIDLNVLERLAEGVTKGCNNLNKDLAVSVVDLAAQTGDTWPEIDERLAKALADAEQEGDYTVVLLSTQAEPVYEASFNTPLQMELKRSEQHLQRRKENGTKWDDLALFEKYQFFTPGIFMGIIVVAILLAILGVGVRALSSLEVPYGAFEKDMGPAAQKKQQ